MSLPSLENTSTSTIPTELTVSPYFRQSREFMGDTNERMVVENAGHNSTPVPTANIVTISPVVGNKEVEKNPTSSISRLHKVGSSFKNFVGFIGPGYIIAVGYLDPGNWATDLTGGSQFGYSLLFIIFISNIMAMILQALSIKLGVVTGMDLAQACHAFLPKYLNYVLYVFCELAIIACDLAEIIGSAIAMNLLFSIPLPAGVAITACDILLILLIYRDNDIKAANLFEILLMSLVGIVAFCYVIELVYSKPNSGDVLKGYLPSSGIFTNPAELYIAIGIIGATVMPHNLYLHSHLVKVRTHREESKGFNERLEKDDGLSRKSIIQSIINNTLKLSIIDSTVALSIALFVNSAILIVSGANFFYNTPNGSPAKQPADLFDAYDLLTEYLGKVASTIFAIALLTAGQSATLTATVAGQVVMEGFIGWKAKPWIRRLITRGFAVLPAMVIASIRGRSGLNDLLVASQVALSLQLPFAVIPLVWFTSNKRFMQVDIRDLEEKVMTHNLNNNIIDPSVSLTPNVNNAPQPYNENNHNDILDFSNSILLSVISVVVSFVILVLDLYLVFTTIQGSISS